jgi:hypothetical protein
VEEQRGGEGERDLDVLRLAMSGSKMQSRVSFAVESVDGVDGAHVQQPHHHLVIPTEGEREGESQCEGTRGEGGREGGLTLGRRASKGCASGDQ